MHSLRPISPAVSSATKVAASIALGAALTGITLAHAHPASAHEGEHGAAASPHVDRAAPLVAKVRAATMRYVDVNVAVQEGWKPATPCVSGPAGGAMGVHFVLPSRIPDGALKAGEPEALIYEPLADGSLRLVGVEYIVLAADWARLHPDGPAPSVDGHLTNYVGEPNRYGLPAFHELHVWAWEGNPLGSFADWNTRVTCDRQRAE